MLALAIFAGVLAAIYASWSAILRGSRVALTAAADAQRSRIAVRAIEEAFACAQAPPARANAPLYAFLVDTTAEVASLSFVAHLPESYPRSGRFIDHPVRRVEIEPEPDPDGGVRLVLRQTPLLFDIDPDEQANPLVLARGVEAFTVQFWGGSEWIEEWRNTNALPRVVRFTLVTRPRGTDATMLPRTISRVVPLPGVPLPGMVAPQNPAIPPSQPPVQPPPGGPNASPTP